MILARVYARRHGMAVVRPDGRRATAEAREKKKGAECGEKNGSHDFPFVFSVNSDDAAETTVSFLHLTTGKTHT
jgi:hypothetical protein